MDEKKPIPYVIRMSDGNVIKMEHHEHLPSVSALAKQYAMQGYPDRYVVLAEGVDGSSERGLYMSLILRPSIFPAWRIAWPAPIPTADARGVPFLSRCRLTYG